MIFIKTNYGLVNAEHIVRISTLMDLEGDVSFTYGLGDKEDICHWSEFKKLGLCEGHFKLDPSCARDNSPSKWDALT